jgi:RimJ/RimL family protein N-acetyltransferase
VDDVLTTDRLTLRPMDHKDAAAVHAHWNLPRVRRYLFDGEKISPGLVEDIVADSRHDFAEHGYGLWVMLSDDSMVGVCGLRSTGDGQAELLYSVDPGRWGEGLAAEAGRAVLRHAAGLGLGEVIAETDVENDASARVAERLGMSPLDARQGARGTLRRFTVSPDR